MVVYFVIYCACVTISDLHLRVGAVRGTDAKEPPETLNTVTSCVPRRYKTSGRMLGLIAVHAGSSLSSSTVDSSRVDTANLLRRNVNQEKLGSSSPPYVHPYLHKV